jgi:hypothetical protein
LTQLSNSVFHIYDISETESWSLINFITQGGVGQAIRKHFSALGFIEGKNFILAA